MAKPFRLDKIRLPTLQLFGLSHIDPCFNEPRRVSKLTRHLSAHVNCNYAFNGRFEERSVHATPTMSDVSPWVTYRF